ncbi:YcaO-like family protein [Streptomyces cadmiisoli]|nr:YcaO-like family protein [Streptomyces cadmiisoli]
MPIAPERLTSLGPRSFARDVEVTRAGHAREFEETWATLEPLLPQIPITRVYDTAPMDYLDFPVWQAVTPLAKDLTVHGGKGTSKMAAKLSAVMEAIERASAEELPNWRVARGSYNQLACADAVDPSKFSLPLDTSYHPDATFSWTGAYDLIGNSYALVPTDLVVNPAVEGIVPRIETNGLASGNTYSEATLHALYELIERDAVSQEDFYTIHHDPAFSPRRPLRSIDIDTITAEAAKEFIKKLGKEGLVLRVQDLTSAIGIPVFRAIVINQNFFGREGEMSIFTGEGCDLDPSRAVVRAITEACQAHSSVVTGARDTFEHSAHGQRPATQKRLTSLYSKPGSLPFPQAKRGGISSNILGNVQTVSNLLRGAGLEQCLVSEVTREDLGIPVVRVIIPGIAFPYGKVARTPTLSMLESVI